MGSDRDLQAPVRYDSEVSNLLCLYKDHIQDPTRQRGHPKKLFKRRSRLDIRKFSFPFRVVEIWNSLPEIVVKAPSVNSFENRLDKFGQNQNLVYNY